MSSLTPAGVTGPAYAWREMPAPPRLHSGTPRDLHERRSAERRGTPFLCYRDAEGNQRLLGLDAMPERLSIGRHPATDLAVSWDHEVSRFHASLECIAEEWSIVDDGRARNGTFVNDRRVVGRTRLSDGDVIRVGRTLLTFCDPAAGDGSTTLAGHVRPVDLSPAQRRVLVALCRPIVQARSVAAPASNRQIADELVVSTETVRSHIRALFEALEIGPAHQNQKRAELARVAIERGVVTAKDFDIAL